MGVAPHFQPHPRGPTGAAHSPGVILVGKSKPKIIRDPRARSLKHIVVTLTRTGLVFTAPSHSPFHHLLSCDPRWGHTVLHEIPIQSVRKLSMIRYSDTTCLLTANLTASDGTFLIWLRDCRFLATLNDFDHPGSRRYRKRRRGQAGLLNQIPSSAILFYREPSVGCVICRRKAKLHQIEFPFGARRRHMCPMVDVGIRDPDDAPVAQGPDVPSSPGAPDNGEVETDGEMEDGHESEGEGDRLPGPDLGQGHLDYDDPDLEVARRLASTRRGSPVNCVTCVICLEATSTMKFSPCGHRCVCHPCLAAYVKSKGIATTMFDAVDDDEEEFRNPGFGMW